MNIDHLLPVLSAPEMEELYLLRRYAAQCARVTEFGVHDCTSTWWLLAGKPQKLTSYDIGITSQPWAGHTGAVESEVNKVKETALTVGVEYRFILGNTVEIEIEETDLLFLDSCHTYVHLTQELALHAAKVKKFLVFHDTTVFALVDEGGNPPGLWAVIEEFLAAHPEWKLHERLTNFNGITVLARV